MLGVGDALRADPRAVEALLGASTADGAAIVRIKGAAHATVPACLRNSHGTWSA